MKVIIIGGAKTGYNLYKYAQSHKVPAELYHFPDEYAAKKKAGKEFQEHWKGIDELDFEREFVIITSETAFNRLSVQDQSHLGTHYFLRDKLKLSEIAQRIKTSYTKELDKNDASLPFPLALKAKESMGTEVPFKIKKVNNPKELGPFQSILEHCVLQPYLLESEHAQIAVAGYFDGYETSLIGVEQKNHYPQGISAYVVNKTNEYLSLIKNITEYLKTLGYKGFIEFEFKQNIKTKELFLMDINPRPWGWFYFYLNGIENFKEVVLNDKPVELDMKKVWVNTPRLILANVKGNFKFPKLHKFLSKDFCYEPYF